MANCLVLNSSSKSALNRRMDMYMKEQDHLVRYFILENFIKLLIRFSYTYKYKMFFFCIISSERMVDEQIRIAIDTKENLVSQRVAFKKIQSRMNDLASRFPAVNNLIQKINLKKRKDSIILGLVVGLCTFLLIMYAFR